MQCGWYKSQRGRFQNVSKQLFAVYQTFITLEIYDNAVI